MPDIILSALLSSFLIVRVFKGPWSRNPQYLAVCMVGSTAAMLLLNMVSPGSADGFIAGNGAAFMGAYAAVVIFDVVTGMA